MCKFMFYLSYIEFSRTYFVFFSRGGAQIDLLGHGCEKLAHPKHWNYAVLPKVLRAEALAGVIEHPFGHARRLATSSSLNMQRATGAPMNICAQAGAARERRAAWARSHRSNPGRGRHRHGR